MNRRKFLLQTSAATAGCLAGGLLTGCATTPIGGDPGVAIIVDPADPVAASLPARWAAEQLRRALVARGFDARIVAGLTAAHPGERWIVAAGGNSAIARDTALPAPAGAESLTIGRGRLGAKDALIASGSDARGLSYALTEVADRITLAEDPTAVFTPTETVTERPANPLRSVIRVFVSEVEDKSWYQDRDFWRNYLSLLAAQRFNRLNLSLGLGYDGGYEGGLGLRDSYLHFAYPFLVKVPGYDVRASGLTDAERSLNLEMLRFASDEAAARGMEFQLGLWTHSFDWPNSPTLNHTISGLSTRTQAPYCRDALGVILKECPNITGVTFRIHGESGVPEGSYDLWQTIFSGLNLSGRRLVLDMHAKGMDQPTIDAALTTGLPITIAPKFSSEHMGLPYHQAAIRDKELPVPGRTGRGQYAVSEGTRPFMRYGYGDLLATPRKYDVYHRIWPGTQRLLLWGDPKFAAAYSRAGSFGGALGQEIFDPLSFKGRKGSGLPGGRDGYAAAKLRPAGGDFQKYTYGYRLWGRMMYNPDTPAEIWRRQLRSDYGSAAADAVETALGSASRILPLVTSAHLESASNNNFWPELPVNMSIVTNERGSPFNDTAAPPRFGGVSPLDPQLFSRVEDYADELLAGTVSGKYSPVEVAQWLVDLARVAEVNLGAAGQLPQGLSPGSFARLVPDVKALSGLGFFYGRKLRAAVLYALYDRTGQRAALDAAVASYRSARDAWTTVAAATKGVYVADLSWGDAWYQHGHWSDRLSAIDTDIAAMAALTPDPTLARTVSGIAPEKMAGLVRQVTGAQTPRPGSGVTHQTAAGFRPGQPLGISLGLAPGQTSPKEARLYYRHANQAERWPAPVTMQRSPDGFTASIPADYAGSTYMMTYYFELADAAGRLTLYPGLAPTLDNQPYFVVKSA